MSFEVKKVKFADGLESEICGIVHVMLTIRSSDHVCFCWKSIFCDWLVFSFVILIVIIEKRVELCNAGCLNSLCCLYVAIVLMD